MAQEPASRDKLQQKLAPALVEVIEGRRTTAGFLKDGKAEVQIWLNDASPASLAKLKELGFEVITEPESGKIVTGRLPVAKLAALAGLKFVRYVAPL